MSVRDGFDWVGDNSTVSKGLRSLLVQHGFINADDKSFDQSPRDTLPIAFYASRGFFSESEVIEKISEILNIEVFRLADHSAKELVSLLSQDPFRNVVSDRWKEMRAIPIRMTSSTVWIAMADPLDLQSRNQLQFTFDRTVVVQMGSEDEILSVLSNRLATEQEEAVELIVKGDSSRFKPKVEASSTSLFESSTKEEDPNAAPVVRLVNKIFSRGIATKASDIHFTPRKGGLSVKARIDGIMQPIAEVPDDMKENVISRVKLLCGMDIAEKRRPQDGRLRITTDFGVKDLRISVVPSAHGENLVARILSSDMKGTNFDELGIPETVQENIKDALKNSCKVILVTGPTGSGKTSTLYSSLLHLHDKSRNIITLEDPIEYRIDGITQIQVNPKVNFGFADGLRSILRQDPDVVLVGEIRDEETASISMKTAQTGHLVLSTLHTNTAAAAITRLRDLGVPPYLITSSLGAVLAQRLVRKVCPDCSLPLSKEKREQYGLSEHAREAIGCDKCRDTGYRGRVGVFSFLQITSDVSKAIREGLGEDEIERRAEGFESLEEASWKLINTGVTTCEEVERVVGSVRHEGDYLLDHVVRQGEDSKVSSKGLISQPKLLLVEDDFDQREVYRMIFEGEMFDVIYANDGREALEKLCEQRVDVVVCDIMMPRLDGFSFLKRIRSMKETKSLPVLMLTAAGSETIETDLISSGADDYLPKASSVNVLVARVRRLVDRASDMK
ncbi:MAG: type II/IV secretion system protein [Bdellovibrionales bacterium]|nr:type II/IV secretion system protein [Bdellovibrionales bacterium]